MPAASTTRCSFVSSCSPIWVITPPSIRTSRTASTRSSGSRTRAPRTTMFSCPAFPQSITRPPTAVSTATGPRGQQVVQHRHADDEPGAHLVDDERRRRVGDPRIELDAAVHRAGVHDALAGSDALGRDPPARRVLAQRRHEARTGEHSLALHAQDVDHVGVGDRRDVVRDRRKPRRNERRRADEDRVGADKPQRLDERPRDARVRDVADDRDVQPVETAECLAQRVQVEQRLRRMLVLAVAGVHDARVGVFERRRSPRPPPGAGRRSHPGRRPKRQCRVLQRLALVDRRARGLDVQRVGREPLRGQLERRRGARRGLVEEVEHEPAAERRQLLRVALLRTANERAVASRRSTSSRVRSATESR